MCSGSVADDGGNQADVNGNALILTAGHCVVAIRRTGRLRDQLDLLPRLRLDPHLTRCSSRDKYGCWTATSLVAHTGFTSQTLFNSTAITHDFAFAVVGPGGNDTSELDVRLAGEYPVGTSISSPGSVTAFGYPQAAPLRRARTWCTAMGHHSPTPASSNLTWGLGCYDDRRRIWRSVVVGSDPSRCRGHARLPQLLQVQQPSWGGLHVRPEVQRRHDGRLACSSRRCRWNSATLAPGVP